MGKFITITLREHEYKNKIMINTDQIIAITPGSIRDCNDCYLGPNYSYCIIKALNTNSKGRLTVSYYETDESFEEIEQMLCK